jgi:hypothetical protein
MTGHVSARYADQLPTVAASPPYKRNSWWINSPHDQVAIHASLMPQKSLWPRALGREVGISSATVRRSADCGVVEVVRDATSRRRFKPEALEILHRKLGLKEVVEGAKANHGHAPDAA